MRYSVRAAAEIGLRYGFCDGSRYRTSEPGEPLEMPVGDWREGDPSMYSRRFMTPGHAPSLPATTTKVSYLRVRERWIGPGLSAVYAVETARAAYFWMPSLESAIIIRGGSAIDDLTLRH